MGDAEETRDAREPTGAAPPGGKHPDGQRMGGQHTEGGHAELEQLRRAMETRPVIDQAHGVLMAAYRCTPDHAWDVLVTVSQHTNTKLHKVASALVASTQGNALPEPYSSALRTALREASTAVKRDEAGQDA